MNLSLLTWGGLIVVLCLTTFGLWWCITLTFSLIVCFVGGLTYLYLRQGESSQKYFTPVCRSRQDSKPGLGKVTQLMDVPSREYKADRRLTGSQVIDESLQEIIGYVLRDYVSPWYDRLSTDAEFPHEVRQTAQRVIVTFAGRMKEVDWIPYLTTRLVDDAASHLRLFRQARAKMKQHRSRNKQHSSQEGKPSLTSTSESGVEAAKRTAKQQQQQQQQQQQIPSETNSNEIANTKPSLDLESIFFDLEVTMEDNLLCRDLVCTDKDSERQYLQDIGEVLLFLLLPVDDFHCKPLRFLLRELLVSAVVLPLFGLVSDPDYINQIIIWLVTEIFDVVASVLVRSQDMHLKSKQLLFCMESKDNLNG